MSVGTATTLWIGSIDMTELQLEGIATEIEKRCGEFLAALGASPTEYTGNYYALKDTFVLCMDVTPNGNPLKLLGLLTRIRDDAYDLYERYAVWTEPDDGSNSVSYYVQELSNRIEGEILETVGDIIPERTLMKSMMYRYCKMQLSMSPQNAAEYLSDGKGPRYLAAKHFLAGESK